MEPVNLSVPAGEGIVEQADIAASIGADYKPYTPLYERFGILNTNSERVNRNLDVIWTWAKNHAETPDKDAILWQITKLTHRIGDAPYGSAPYTKVLGYISEYNRMIEAEKRLKMLEGM